MKKSDKITKKSKTKKKRQKSDNKWQTNKKSDKKWQTIQKKWQTSVKCLHNRTKTSEFEESN